MNFIKKYEEFIKNQDEIIRKESIPKPKTEDDKKHNKKLYNKKSDGIVSMLRTHFKEYVVNEEQHDWFGGNMRLKVGDSTVTFSMYSKEKRSRRHKLEKKEKWTMPKNLRQKKTD